MRAGILFVLALLVPGAMDTSAVDVPREQPGRSAGGRVLTPGPHEGEVVRHPTAAEEQRIKDLKARIALAESDVAMWRERAAWAHRMSGPGRNLVPRNQAQADQARAHAAEADLAKLKRQLRDLTRQP